MVRDPARELRQVTEEIMGRIRDARRAASVQVAALLGLIEEHLLDPDLQIQDLLKWSEIDDKNVSTRFKQELGLGPWEYITQCRMTIAVHGLEATDLKIWQIATNAGFSGGPAFGRAFKRWSGKTPKQFRRAARKSSGRSEPLAAPADLVNQ